MTAPRPRLLVNLPAGFFDNPALTALWQRLDGLAEVRKTSCNTSDEILPFLKEADAVLMWSWPRFTPEMLAECPELKFSANLDLTQAGAKTLLAHGMAVSIGRRAFSPAVAEMALTLILAALRRTSSHHAQMWQGDETWVKAFPDDIDPDERQLTGRSVGIVGFGGVGHRLAQLLAPFQCDLAIYDPYLPASVPEQQGVKPLTLDALVAHSEILVLCASANEGSDHLLGAAQIQALRPRAVLVNVARASLVDTDALIARLQKGDLYAALDVFDKEPLPADSPLRSLPNVYLTPHRAGGIIESVQRILTYLIDDYEAFLHGAERRHALTEAMLPTLDVR